MRIEVLADAEAVALRAAQVIAEEARAAIAARGRFLLAVSGGRTPWRMLRALADVPLPWGAVHVFQVDERKAPPGDPDRNLTHLDATLLSRVPLPAAQVHPMPVDAADLAAAAASYGRELEAVAGAPPVLDLVHLGLGPDGHTASLVPADPVLEVSGAPVAVTRPYQGRARMTLTFPVLDAARRVLWVVAGADKAVALSSLLRGDRSIPAGRVAAASALVLADAAAAGQ